jgi:hypothetical protein
MRLNVFFPEIISVFSLSKLTSFLTYYLKKGRLFSSLFIKPIHTYLKKLSNNFFLHATYDGKSVKHKSVK